MDRQIFKTLLLRFPGFQALCRRLTRGHVRTLLYHRFSPGTEDQPRFLNAKTLRSQVEYVRRHHATWKPSDHLEALRSGNKPLGCPVVITVDDGYLDFYDVAFPIFAEHRVPAVLFLSTRFVDGQFWMWWDQLRYVLEKAPGRTHKLQLAHMRLTLDLTTAQGREAAWHEIADRCRFSQDSEKTRAIDELGKSLGVQVPQSPDASFRAVTWEQVREMVAHGIVVGSHTVNHPILTRVSLAQAADEIQESKRRLEKEIGQPVPYFCYPQGGPADLNHDIQRLVSEAGFAGSYIAFEESSVTPDPYRLPRIIVKDDATDFEWKLCGAHTLLKKARAALGFKDAEVGPEYWAGSPEASPGDPRGALPAQSAT